jgi:hypothetical protein
MSLHMIMKYKQFVKILVTVHFWLPSISGRLYGVYKKKVIEIQRAIVSELLCVWTRFFHNRKDHAFICWMISSSCQMDKKLANTNPIKNVSQNRIFSPLRVGSKTIENEPPLGFKLMNYTSLNCTHILLNLSKATTRSWLIAFSFVMHCFN